MSGPAVFKFGGSSLADEGRVRAAAALVAAEATPPIVVVSAPGRLTERLVAVADGDAGDSAVKDLAATVGELAKSLGGEGLHTRIATLLRERVAAFDASGPGDPTRRDALLATGEDISSRLMVAALAEAGCDARGVDAREVIRTDDAFGAAAPRVAEIRARAGDLAGMTAAGTVPVVQGFIGADPDGRTTTLGRGGSDLTAALLGVAVESSAVHIWTDVDGILTGDPHWVERPRSLDVVGFEEAVELAWFGARVLHPGAAKHAVAHRLPVRIRSTFAPERPGTLVLAERWGGPHIAAVACKREVALVQVRSRPSAMEYGFLANVFGTLTQYRTPVDLVATSHTSTAFTVDAGAELDALATALDAFAEVETTVGLATVTVVGRGLLQEPGFSARVFQTVAFTPVRLISQATDSSLSFLVDDSEAEALVRRLHLVLIEGRPTLGSGADTPSADRTGTEAAG